MSTQDLVILYTNEVSATMGREIRFNLRLKNNTDAAMGLSTVTIRYWMSAEPAPRFAIDYAATGLRANSPPTFVTNAGNSYVEFSFGATGSVIPYVDNNTLEQTRINVRIDTTLNTPQFNQSNDWSFDGTSGQLKANAKITAYDGDTLIFGCEPSQTCAEPSAPSGEGGAGS
jgi:endoglucanase